MPRPEAEAVRNSLEACDLVRRLQGALGENLQSVLLHGSWVRGEASPASDVDALAVVDKGIPVNRSFVAEVMSEHPADWQGHDLDLIFATIPTLPSFSMLWSEIALERIMLYERDDLLQRYLEQIQQWITDEVLEQKFEAGVSYWVVNR